MAEVFQGPQPGPLGQGQQNTSEDLLPAAGSYVPGLMEETR